MEDLKSTDTEFEKYKIGIAKIWLDNCKRLISLEKTMKDLVDTQKDLADGIGSVDFTRPFTKSSPRNDAMIDCVEHCMAIAADFEAMAKNISDQRLEVTQCLLRINDPIESTILTRHYLLGEPWVKIGKTLRYSRSYIMKLRRSALLSAYDVMPHIEKDPMHQAI